MSDPYFDDNLYDDDVFDCVGVMRRKPQMETREKVYSAINDERTYQTRKWGTVQQHPHEVGGYLTIMRKLMNDAEAAWASSNGDKEALDEIRKVVAVGVACMEQHGAVPRNPLDFVEQSGNFVVHRKEN